MEFLRKPDMSTLVTFGLEEAKQIYEYTQKGRLYTVLAESGLSLEELEANNGQKKHEIADKLVAKGLRSKEEVEFFLAIDVAFAYFKENNPKICFVLKEGLRQDKIEVRDIEDLKSIMAENTPTDFAISVDEGLRQFQLKRYKSKLDTQSFFGFLTKTLGDYGTGLNQINLLVVLQNPYSKIPIEGMQENRINSTDIHNMLQELNLKYNGQILVLYNESNQYTTLVQVYPELKMMQTKLSPTDSGWE